MKASPYPNNRNQTCCSLICLLNTFMFTFQYDGGRPGSLKPRADHQRSTIYHGCCYYRRPAHCGFRLTCATGFHGKSLTSYIIRMEDHPAHYYHSWRPVPFFGFQPVLRLSQPRFVLLRPRQFPFDVPQRRLQ